MGEVTRLYAPEWREDQKLGRYPFADTASLKAKTGLELRVDAFLDALVYPPGLRAGAELTSLTVGIRSVAVAVGDASSPARASVTFDPLAAPGVLRLSTPDGRSAGVLVADPSTLAEFQVWPQGVHAFASGAAAFAAGVVVPSPDTGLIGFLLDDGTLLTGDVWIVAEDGVVVRTTDDGDVRFDVVGDPLYRRRVCLDQDGSYEAPRAVKTINSVPPNSRGDFKIVAGSRLAADSVLRVVTVPPDQVKVYAAAKSAAKV